VCLFLLSLGATLTIASSNPLPSWGYALGVALLAAFCSRVCSRPNWSSLALWFLGVIGTWGCVQLVAGATVYRYATWDVSARTVALFATTVTAVRVLQNPKRQIRFLRALSIAGFGVTVLAVLNRLTSEGRMFWFVPASYPDVWGPFLSRNDFATFLELAFPIVLWFGTRRHRAQSRTDRTAMAAYLGMAGFMLAAGLFSASRTGSVLLMLETLVVLLLNRPRRSCWLFVGVASLCIALMSPATLLRRLSEPDPIRGQLLQSSVAMVSDRPWTGFGLGTYADAYPAYSLFDPGGRIEHAHNQWLEWAAEGGVPYAAAWFGVVASIARRSIRSVWGIGVLSVFLHALVDYPFARFGITAWTFSLIGILCVDEMREVGTRIH
jgi:O-antigen ligase